MSIDFKHLPHGGIQSLIPYKPGKSIEELAREQGLTDIIKLASNENPMGCSPLARQAIQQMSSHTFATYPSPLNHSLIPKLAAHLGVNVNQVFVSNGSDVIFGTLLNCFALHTGKHMLTHEYAFSAYAIQANTLNIPVNTAAINADWSVNIDNLIHACNEQTALVFLANPNNPTGLLIEPAEIKRLLEHIPQQTILVVDEAYFEFAEDYFSCNSIDWLKQYPNLVITRTFSKIYGLAGLRLGYAIAHPDIIELLNRVQLPFAVNQIALAAGAAALSDHEFLQSSLTINKEGMTQMLKGLHALELYTLPSTCNFLTFDCQEDGIKLYNYLLSRGIIVRPLHAYKMNNYIRVSIGTKEQNTRFLQALNNYYNKYNRT